MDVIDGHSTLDVFLGQATNLNTGVEADWLFLDGVGVARRPLGAGDGGALGLSRTPEPIFSLDNSITIELASRIKYPL